MNLRYAAGVLAQPAADGASDVLRAQDGYADQARAVTQETGSRDSLHESLTAVIARRAQAETIQT